MPTFGQVGRAVFYGVVWLGIIGTSLYIVKQLGLAVWHVAIYN